jgi:hypothetical protein
MTSRENALGDRWGRRGRSQRPAHRFDDLDNLALINVGCREKLVSVSVTIGAKFAMEVRPRELFNITSSACARSSCPCGLLLALRRACHSPAPGPRGH